MLKIRFPTRCVFKKNSVKSLSLKFHTAKPLLIPEIPKYNHVDHFFIKQKDEMTADDCFTIGRFYLMGEGDIPKNEKIAFSFFERAAKMNNESAQFIIACLYFDGIIVPKNEDMALYWFNRSANLNHPGAEYFLGSWYLENSFVDKLYESKAFSWIEKSAFRNFSSDAQYKLAECYYSGIGCEKNNVLALHWYEKSGHENCDNARKIKLERQKMNNLD
jgi:hypothetical protein